MEPNPRNMLDERDRMKTKHAHIMSDVINKKGYTKIAEVGVWKGLFLNDILSECPGITEYWAIDSWNVSNVPGNKKLTPTQEYWDNVYMMVCNALKYYPQLKIINYDATAAAKLFPKGYFDLVFIDADHGYESVLNDLTTWTPLVRKGGMMSGHDHRKTHMGVKTAVAEFYGRTAKRLPATCWVKEIK